LITRDLVEDINHQNYTLDWVSGYEQAREWLMKDMHEVYLVDYRLGRQTGLDLLSYALEQGLEKPIILLTGQGDFEIDQLAMASGASDYLVKKDLTADRLERAIRYSIQQATNLKKIRQLNQDLEKRVEARTEALAMAVKDLESQIGENQKKEQALRKSQEELRIALTKEQQLNEMKSRFVSMASHEFRTPLATILSSISLIDKYELPEHADRRKKHIERIKSNVHALTTILNDFLSISKLEEGKISSHEGILNLGEKIREITEEMQTQTKEGQVIQLDYAADVDMVILDGQIMRNVLNNLISNAIKYSPPNAQIYISARLNSGEFRLEVKDQGIGIPEDEQAHLFERFFRARNVTNIQGTGLGLSIVKRYIELLKGTIDFHSIPDEGTTFTIILPIKTP
ncbi:MAG: hybrid sensor histidine kinase/response regulator, partial [Bacteroidota bacterium]